MTSTKRLQEEFKKNLEWVPTEKECKALLKMGDMSFEKIESKIRKAAKSGKLALKIGKKNWYYWTLVITEYSLKPGFVIDVYTQDTPEHLGRLCILSRVPCACKRWEQIITGEFICVDCGRVDGGVLCQYV